jgi:hypothetical protein
MKKSIILFLLLLVIINSSFAFKGRVLNNKGEIVSGAEVRFENSEDSSQVFMAYSDTDGYFELDLPFKSQSFKGFEIFESYPNPFTNKFYFPLFLYEGGHVKISIYNLQGSLIANVFEGHKSAGVHQILFEKNKQGKKINPGLYFIEVNYNAYTKCNKILLLSDGHLSINPSMMPDTDFIPLPSNDEILYNISIKADLHQTLVLNNYNLSELSEPEFFLNKFSPIPFACVGNYIGIETDDGFYEPVFINGINLGVGMPGTSPGELAIPREVYREWFEMISDIGFNSIRIYTLHFPRFYEELAYYNQMNPENPIYLFQGIWLEEEGFDGNLFTFSTQFEASIREVIDCVYGNNNIEHRFGRAYGLYNVDVSPYIMAYIIGREIHPWEVILTDSLNSDKTEYIGNAVSIYSASPSAVWFTERIDYLINYERNQYESERPVSQSSWPTLDPLSHPTEQFDSTEDIAEIDLSDIDIHNAPAGYFASYHAYPYFPDFISEQPNYQTYSDEHGPNSYLGYLDDLKSHYSGMPLIIAEYGVPSSWGNAHYAHSGMNHGGQSESKQGYDNVRLMENIHSSRCGGGFLFAWMDEWFKACWITDPISTVKERRHLWHNITSAEENFGLISFDVPEPEFNKWNPTYENCHITKVVADYDNEFFYLRLTTDEIFSGYDKIWIALDTYRSDLGESILPNGASINNRAEFALEISYNNAQLYVTQAYDLFAIWFGTSAPEQLFRSIVTDGEPWNPVLAPQIYGQSYI